MFAAGKRLLLLISPMSNKDPQKRRETRRKYYDANIEKCRERSCMWAKENRDRHNELCRKNYKPLKDKARNLRRNYGMTIEQYFVLLEKQNGICAICGSKPKKIKLAVDHNHKTGIVRGLLFFLCNTKLSIVD